MKAEEAGVGQLEHCRVLSSRPRHDHVRPDDLRVCSAAIRKAELVRPYRLYVSHAWCK